MTQVMVVAPRAVGRLASVDEAERLLSTLIDGDIGANIKTQLVEIYGNILEGLFQDIEKARLEAIAAYAELQVAVRKIMMDGELLSSLEFLYSPIIASNYRFALNSLMTLLRILRVAVQQTEAEESQLEELDIEGLKARFHALVSESNKMQDATLIKEKEDAILSDLVLALNMGMYIMLVFLVASVAKKEKDLSTEQIEQFEVLLRDWPQEVMGQLAVIGNRNTKRTISFNLTGIIPDEEDFELVESGLLKKPQDNG